MKVSGGDCGVGGVECDVSGGDCGVGGVECDVSGGDCGIHSVHHSKQLVLLPAC